MPRPRPLAVLLLAFAAPGCTRSAPSPVAFEVVRVAPAVGDGAEPLLLNDSLTVYFSDSVQQLSVTPESVVLVDERGHRVPGSLRAGSNWVTFLPIVPIAPDLGDGSFRPGATYRLTLVGAPRPDALRASDGRRLAGPRAFDVKIAPRDHRAPGLVAPLRPVAEDLPFVVRPVNVPQVVAADSPRLRLHFTLPVLPASVATNAFDVRFAPNGERIRPRSVRVVRSRADEFDGSTVEIDLGALPGLEGTWLSVVVVPDSGLVDYAGRPPLPSGTEYWSVVPGSSIALAEWPSAEETTFADDDVLAPCFEVRSGIVRPRVRVEAGDGSLGLFRPQRDTTLRAGVPFDRGDGRQVVSTGNSFPFSAIDVPAGVRVVVDAASGPVQLLACGGVRIAGEVEIVGGAARVDVRPFRSVAVSELLASANVAIVAGGDVRVEGAVGSRDANIGGGSPLTIAAAGCMHLGGALPFNTLLAFEEGNPRAISGPSGQVLRTPTTFTYGAAPGLDLVVRGYSGWRLVPVDRDAGVIRLSGADRDLLVGWQVASPDPLRAGRPDVPATGLARPQRVADGDVLSVTPGGWVRVQLEARVTADSAPAVQDVRLVDR